MADNRFEVQHQPARQRYALIDHGQEGSDDREIGEELYLDVDQGQSPGSERIFYHTLVSEDYAGQGLASVLVRTVVDDAVASGRAIVPVCPYVAAWLPRHPEYAAHVVRPTGEHLRLVREHAGESHGGEAAAE